MGGVPRPRGPELGAGRPSLKRSDGLGRFRLLRGAGAENGRAGGARGRAAYAQGPPLLPAKGVGGRSASAGVGVGVHLGVGGSGGEARSHLASPPPTIHPFYR